MPRPSRPIMRRCGKQALSSMRGFTNPAKVSASAASARSSWHGLTNSLPTQRALSVPGGRSCAPSRSPGRSGLSACRWTRSTCTHERRWFIRQWDTSCPGNGRSYPTAADTPAFRVSKAATPSAAELLMGGAGSSDHNGKASEGHGPEGHGLRESGKVGNFLPALIRGGQVDTVLVCMCDMQGRLVGKRVTGRHFLSMLGHDMHACDYLLAVDVEMLPIPGLEVSSWEKGFGDFSIRPDLGTARLVPWIPGTAVVLGDTVDAKGTLAPHAPRSVLRNQIERLKAAGFSALFASELEFYVFRGDWKAARRGSYRGLEPDGFYSEDYQIFQTSGKERLMRSIRNGMEAAGIAIESSKGEGGPGQAEINLLYAETLEMADRHVIYKNGVKELAQAHD